MAGRRYRAQPRRASSARLIVALSVILALGTLYLRLPGVLALLAGVTAAAWMEPQPELTGSKGTPANDAEEARLARYGFWSDLRLGAFSPAALSPGWPVRASFLAAALCAAGAYGVPVFAGWARAADAASAFLLVAAVTGVRRRNANPEGDHPAVRVDTLPKAGRAVLAAGTAGTAGALAAGILLHGKLTRLAGHRVPRQPGLARLAGEWLGYRPEWESPDLWLTIAAVAVLAGLAVIGRAWCAAALEGWRALTGARATWNPRWRQLRMDPPPQAITVRSLTHPAGASATDIEFACPPHLGFTDFETLAPKLHPMTGQGTSVSILPVRETGPEGMVPGSTHPSRFRVVVFTMPAPDVSDQGTSAEWAALFLEAAVRQAAGKLGFPRPVMVSCEQVPAASPPGNGEAPGPDADPGAGLIWATEWAFPDDMPLRALARESGALAATARTGAQVDAAETGTVYFGALDQAPLELAALLARRRADDEWAARWGNVKAVQQQNPAYQHGTYRELALPDGGVLCTAGFLTRQGQDPAQFRTASMEAALRPAMGASLQFLSATAWRAPSTGPDREGERHHGAFRLSWSTSKVPSVPAVLRPCPAAQHILAGMADKAFDAVRLPRPEVLGVRALASGGSHVQLWEIRFRLFDGVTAGQVRGQLERMRTTIGAEWLRAEDAGEGCTLYAGDPPAAVELASPLRDEAHLIALDWEQAWRNSGVKGVAGALPKLMGPVSSMPKNPAIKILDYQLPDSVEISEVREKKVRNRLGNQTGNGWVLIRSHPETVGAVRVLCAEKNPMPTMVPYDWAHGSSLKCLPFATGEDGEPVSVDWTAMPHLLLVGTSGPQPLGTRIPVPISEKFPDGWARFGDLAVGDSVFTAHGDTTTVTELHPVQRLRTYTLRLSDGQRIECGPDHLWKASNSASRMSHSDTQTARRGAFQGKRRELAARLRTIADSVPEGTVATLDEIVRTYGHQAFRRVAPKSIASPGFVPGRPARLYLMDDVAKKLSRSGTVTIEGSRFDADAVLEIVGGLCGQWLSLREFADAVTRPLAGRDSTRADRMLLKHWTKGAASRPGTALKPVDLYPVDEVIRLYADDIENNTTWRCGQPLEMIVSAREMTESLSACNAGPNWAIRVPDGVEVPDADLMIPPYLLGAWLGDGKAAAGSITVGGEDYDEMMRILRDEWPVAEVVPHSRDHRNKDVNFPRRYAELCYRAHPGGYRSVGYCPECQRCDRDDGGRNRTLGGLLRVEGVLGAKHIPARYLRASRAQRLALLQGLMDTDGTVDRNGSCELCLCDKRLVTDALELIRSLGIKCSMTESPASVTEDDPDAPGRKRQRITGTRYRLHFTTTQQVFRLPRKAGLIPETTRLTQGWLYVEDITVSGETVPMRCISVADSEHLYLTDGFVPTHNSGKSSSSQCLVYGALTGGFKVAVIDPTKGGADFAFADDHLLYRATKLPGKPEVETYRVAAAAMKAIYTEGKRRIDLCNIQGVGSYRELDDPPPPVLVFFDEFAGILDVEKGIPAKPYDDPELEAARLERREVNDHKLYMALCTANIAAELRSAGIHLILCTQRLTAKLLDSVPKGDTLRTNLARAILGKATFGELQSALRSPMLAPEHGEHVPKGRGIFEPLESAAVLTQGWFATQAEYRDQLRARVPALGEAGKLDITPFLPKEDDRENLVGVARPAGSARAVPEEIEVDAVEVDASFWDEDDDAPAEEQGGPASDLVSSGDAASPAGEPSAEAARDATGPGTLPSPSVPGTLIMLEPEGALCPVSADRDRWAAWPDWEASGPYEAVSRTMLTRLGKLSCRDTVIAWLPGRAGDANTVLAPHIGAGDPLPSLPSAQDGVTGWPELDAVITCLRASPGTARVCWIGASLCPGTGAGQDPDVARAVLARLGIDALLIATDPASGLTQQQMDDVEDWAPRPEPGADDDEDADPLVERPQTVLVCEVDGVVRGPFGGEVSQELLQAIRAAEQDGKIRLAWLTTWGESVNASIGRKLGGQPREVIPVPPGEPVYGERKLDALDDWLAVNPDVKQVIWADPVAAAASESGFGTVGDEAARIAGEHSAELSVADLSGGMLTPQEVALRAYARHY